MINISTSQWIQLKLLLFLMFIHFLAFIYGLKFILKFKKLKSCILSIDDLFRNHIP